MTREQFKQRRFPDGSFAHHETVLLRASCCDEVFKGLSKEKSLLDTANNCIYLLDMT